MTLNTVYIHDIFLIIIIIGLKENKIKKLYCSLLQSQIKIIWANWFGLNFKL